MKNLLENLVGKKTTIRIEWLNGKESSLNFGFYSMNHILLSLQRYVLLLDGQNGQNGFLFPESFLFLRIIEVTVRGRSRLEKWEKHEGWGPSLPSPFSSSWCDRHHFRDSSRRFKQEADKKQLFLPFFPFLAWIMSKRRKFVIQHLLSPFFGCWCNIFVAGDIRSHSFLVSYQRQICFLTWKISLSIDLRWRSCIRSKIRSWEEKDKLFL